MTTETQTRPRDSELRLRAAQVIPGGMYGHNSVANMYFPPNYPQFLAGGHGAYIDDVDGNEYIDLMCSYGPIVLGHGHPAVEEAARRQAEKGDCLDAPSEVMVELAELLTQVIDHAEWAVFAKNGSDATTACVTIARAATGRATILAANGSYHGASSWCTPWSAGVLASDRAGIGYFDYNDLPSVEEAVDQARGDLAGIIITPAKHIEGVDQEPVEVDFARTLRHICDEHNALLILDDVRCGFRLNYGGSWEPIGVSPDLSAWSKAIANGYALSAVVGSEDLRAAASSVWLTGSFWFSSVAMSASLATLRSLKAEEAVPRMKQAGVLLRRGIEGQARDKGLSIRCSGHPTMPYIVFSSDQEYERMTAFCRAALDAGLYLAPRHNWFLSAAHTEEIIASALDRTEQAFEVVVREFGSD